MGQRLENLGRGRYYGETNLGGRKKWTEVKLMTPPESQTLVVSCCLGPPSEVRRAFLSGQTRDRSHLTGKLKYWEIKFR
eukprot:scaffold3596_cov126-Cylindrotheca_fusiformis.AAC.9